MDAAVVRHARLIALVFAISCSASTDVDRNTTPAVVQVVPGSYATGVNPEAAITITFSHSMMAGMEALVVLHEGSVTGPVVAAAASWSDDRRILTITPVTALKARTTYVLHLAPDLRSSTGAILNHDACSALGGQNVTGGMGPGGIGPGGMGPGRMGGGWNQSDGFYGMTFTFTTA